MKIEEMIEKSLNTKPADPKYRNKKYKSKGFTDSVRDMMDGTYYIRNFAGEKRGAMWMPVIIKHCSGCSDVWAVFANSDANYKITECSSECRRTKKQKELEPIEFEGKLFTLDDCSKTEINNYNNPIKSHINSIKKRKIRRAKPGYKEYEAKKSAKWRSKNPKTEEQRISDNKKNNDNYYTNRESRLTQQKEYGQRPEVKKATRLYKREWEKKDREKNFGRYLVKNIINHILRNSNAGKVKPISKYGFDVKSISEHLENTAKQLGFTKYSCIKQAGYEVDHIIPRSVYNLEGDNEDLINCNSIYNLRWLKVFENRSKWDKIRPQDLEIIMNMPKGVTPKRGFLKVKELTTLVKDLYK